MRLNLGCGPVVPDGWVNVDPVPYAEWGDNWVVPTCSPAKQQASAGGIYQGDPLAGLRWVDNSAEGAVAHHVLQALAWPDLVPWLTEVRRVLRPGAWLRLSVPDLELADWWLSDDCYRLADDHPERRPPIADRHEFSDHGKVCLWLSQAGATRSVFTGTWLVELCQRAGYSRCAVTAYRKRYGSAPGWLTDLDDQPDRRHESVYVQARA